MLRFVLVSVNLLVALATPILDSTLDKDWGIWKTQHDKQYGDKHEELKRRVIWEDNLNMINVHNLEHNKGLHTFTMAMNHFGDMTLEEINERNGFKQAHKNHRLGSKYDEHYKPSGSNYSLPKSVDWRKEGYVTPVEDQGKCGSCWTFSTTGSVEGQYFAKTGTLVSLSKQQLVDCDGRNHGCNGGRADRAFKYIEEYGIETEEDYPYTDEEDTCQYSVGMVVTKVTGYKRVEFASESDLQDAVATVGPVSVAIDANHSSFHFYRSGVYSEPSCNSWHLGHALLAVGYGTDPEYGQDYWLVKNSWSTYWGDNGYVKMSRNQYNQCGIATDATYPSL